ncbi:hypothetical protein V8F06_013775 [Rhypophila decipiens]
MRDCQFLPPLLLVGSLSHTFLSPTSAHARVITHSCPQRRGRNTDLFAWPRYSGVNSSIKDKLRMAERDKCAIEPLNRKQGRTSRGEDGG